MTGPRRSSRVPKPATRRASTKPRSSTAARAAALRANIARRIQTKPYSNSSMNIPRSFLQSSPPTSHSNNLDAGPEAAAAAAAARQKQGSSSRFSFGESSSASSSTSSALPSVHSSKPRQDSSKLSANTGPITARDKTEIQEIVNLFSPQMLEDYPPLKLVASYAKAAEWEEARSALQVLTKRLEIDLGHDESSSLIFDPTKHKNYAAAMKEFIFEPSPNASSQTSQDPTFRIKSHSLPRQERQNQQQSGQQPPHQQQQPPSKKPFSFTSSQSYNPNNQFRHHDDDDDDDDNDIDNNHAFDPHASYTPSQSFQIHDQIERLSKKSSSDPIDTLLHGEESVVPQAFPSRHIDESEIRAREAFGGYRLQASDQPQHPGSTGPTTAELLAQTTTRQSKTKKRYHIEKDKIDVEVGVPFLHQVQELIKLPLEEREKQAEHPLYGSLSLLTVTEFNQITKDYDFSHPGDVMAYIERYLGRSREEIDHSLGIPRAEYEKIRQDMASRVAGDADIEDYLLAENAAERMAQGKAPWTDEDNSDLDPNNEIDQLRKGVRSQLDISKPTIPDSVLQNENQIAPIAKGISESTAKKLSSILNGAGDGQRNQLIDSFNDWQNGISGNVDPKFATRGLSGIFGETFSTLHEERESHNAALQQLPGFDEEETKNAQQIKEQQERDNIRHRKEFEMSLDDDQLASLRARQIALKLNKQDDGEWIQHKSEALARTFSRLRRDISPAGERMYQLLRMSPEDRIQSIVQKTVKKYSTLYDKYLPQNSPEEEQNDENASASFRDPVTGESVTIDPLLEGNDRDKSIDEKRQEIETLATQELLNKKVEARQIVQKVADLRHKEVLRRSREIEHLERRLELQRQGMSADSISKALDLEDIVRREKVAADLLQSEALKKNLPVSSIAAVDQQADASASAGGKSSSLLDRVRKRRLVKQLAEKQQDGEVVVDQVSGLVEISRESMKKQADEIAERRKIAQEHKNEVLKQQKQRAREALIEAQRQEQEAQKQKKLSHDRDQVSVLRQHEDMLLDLLTGKDSTSQNKAEQHAENGPPAFELDHQKAPPLKTPSLTPKEQRREGINKLFDSIDWNLHDQSDENEDEVAFNTKRYISMPLPELAALVEQDVHDLQAIKVSQDEEQQLKDLLGEDYAPSKRSITFVPGDFRLRRKILDHRLEESRSIALASSTTSSSPKQPVVAPVVAVSSPAASSSSTSSPTVSPPVITPPAVTSPPQPIVSASPPVAPAPASLKSSSMSSPQPAAAATQKLPTPTISAPAPTPIDIDIGKVPHKASSSKSSKQSSASIRSTSDQNEHKTAQGEDLLQSLLSPAASSPSNTPNVSAHLAAVIAEEQAATEKKKKQIALAKEKAERENAEKLAQEEEKKIQKIQKATGIGNKHFASALDAFMASNDPFEQLFTPHVSAEAPAEDVRQGHTDKVVQSPIHDDDSTSSPKHDHDDNTPEKDAENVIDVEGGVNSVLEQKFQDAQAALEAQRQDFQEFRQSQRPSTGLGLLSKLAESTHIEAKTPPVVDKKPSTLPTSDQTAHFPTLRKISQLDSLTSDAQKISQLRQESIHQNSSRRQSLFGKLALESEQLLASKSQPPAPKLAADPDDNHGQPVKRNGLDALTNPHRHKQALNLESVGTASSHGITSEVLFPIITAFRNSLNLDALDNFDQKDLLRTPLLPDEQVDEMFDALSANSEEAQRKMKQIEKQTRVKSKDRVSSFLDELGAMRETNHDGFRLILSAIRLYGGAELITFQNTMESLQEQVLRGEIKDFLTFRTKISNAGVSDELLAKVEIRRLFDDLEAEHLGLDQGGDLVEDEGTPIIKDPLDDYVKQGRSPYSTKTTDFNLLAAKKRSERSTIFQHLDEQVDQDLEAETLRGDGLLSILAAPNMNPDIAANKFGLTQFTEKKYASDRYESKEPLYDPEDPNANAFEDFFAPDAATAQSNNISAMIPAQKSEQRGNILTSLMNPAQREQFESTGKLTAVIANKPSSGILTNPNILTVQELAAVDSQIRDRLQRLVERISRHTMLPAGFILENMESPKTMAKLLGMLTPDMMHEMKMLDQLLGDDLSPAEKRHMLSIGDLRSPKQLTDEQTVDMLPLIQDDIEEFTGEFKGTRPAQIAFVEDQNRDYLKGHVGEHLIQGKTEDPAEFAKRLEAYKAQRRLHHQSLEAERYNVIPERKADDVQEYDAKQQSLIDEINDRMSQGDTKIATEFLIKANERLDGSSRRLITDTIRDRPHPLTATRKAQLARIKVDALGKELKLQSAVLSKVHKRLDSLTKALIQDSIPAFIDQYELDRVVHFEASHNKLLEQNSSSKQKQQDNVVSTELAVVVPPSQLTVANLTPDFIEYVHDQLINAQANGSASSNDLTWLIEMYSSEKVTPAQIRDELAKRGHSTSLFHALFEDVLMELPKQSEASLKLSKFFQGENSGEADEWLAKLNANMERAESTNNLGDELLGNSSELGALVRRELADIDLETLPAETRRRVEESQKELHRVFEDYRKVEIMLDRQLRLHTLETQRKSLGLPDFHEITLIRDKFDVILRTLQTPGLPNKRRQELMDDSRDVMAKMIAMRNLKENDPEIYFWQIFLAKIPPRFHKDAINVFNMPIDPTRLFDDLNPTGQDTYEDTLGNVLQFIKEGVKDTSRVLHHIGLRAQNQHPGLATMTLRDLRKEQLVCKRLLRMRQALNIKRGKIKEEMTKSLNAEYLNQMRMMRVQELMAEPDLAEARRQQLEFWLDSSHKSGKKTALSTNALLQDSVDLEIPVGALRNDSQMIVAHKKMLKYRKPQVNPMMYNSKTARMFSNDQLNPYNQYERILAMRKEKKSLARQREQIEQDLAPQQVAALNAAIEGNRLLAYLGQHGAGSNSMLQDMRDLLSRQSFLLETRKKVWVEQAALLEDSPDDGAENGENQGDDAADLSQRKPRDDLNPAEKISLETCREQTQLIDEQLSSINRQLSQIVAKKHDFELSTHVRHDKQDHSLVHIANQPFVYCRVVASYGQTVVVEQCGSNAYMKHSQFFVEDELEQVQRAAGMAGTRLDNRDNLDEEGNVIDDEAVDENGNPIPRTSLQLTPAERDEQAFRNQHARGSRRRWHCIKSRHMDLLTGDYVFIDPAPGRAWTAGTAESNVQTTFNAMNNTGSADHGVVKATFRRLNQVSKGSRSANKLDHLEEANPICSNADHLVILCAAEGQPPFTTALIDKYLAAAQFSGIKATIVYNKIDLIEMVAQAETIINDLRDRRARLQDKEKTLQKKLGKREFKHRKRQILKDQRKQLRDVHFYTNTMQKYYSKLLYNEALAKELLEMEEEEEAYALEQERRTKQAGMSDSDLYREDEHGRLVRRTDGSSDAQSKPKDYSLPVIVPRSRELATHAIDYYYNDEEYDDEEEQRVLLEQQLTRWVQKKQRQLSRDVEANLREYERLGVKVIRVSAKDSIGVNEFGQLLSRFHTTALVGQSGVGKSSLLNKVIPDFNLQTNSTSVDGKGTHTTTTSRLFHLPNGGSVIDTPGSQSFVPPAVDPEYVMDLFPEIKALAQYCKLGAKCVHTKEVGCAVREAVGDGSNRALIPVTITELFDPDMMNNMRVKEFRLRLQEGELRELAQHPGNDPVLLYAQRYYNDLDDGKISPDTHDVHIPMDTAMDLGGENIELDEQGQEILHGKDEFFKTTSLDTDVLERHPATVIPLELSDIEADGTELPYHIRKTKLQIRELRELVVLKFQQYGDEADIDEEKVEIGLLQHRLEHEMKAYNRQKRSNLRQKAGIEPSENDESSHETAPAESDHDTDAESSDFDINYAYDLEAMQEEILATSAAGLVMNSDNLSKISHDPENLIKSIKDDAMEDARIMAKLDLQDKLEKQRERNVLKFRAERLGISVKKLRELQSKVEAQKLAVSPTTATSSGSVSTPPPTQQQQQQQPSVLPHSYSPEAMTTEAHILPAQSTTRRPTPKTFQELSGSSQIDPSMLHDDEFRQDVLDQIISHNDEQLAAQQEEDTQNQPAWRRQRDKLTQRRFGSRLPADNHAYIPQFRYDSYLSLLKMMQKTKEHLRKRKAKSLTRKEEDKIAWRQKQEQLRDKREVRRRRLEIDQDPFGTHQDKTEKLDKAKQQEFLENRLKQNRLEIPDRLTSMRLLEDDVTKTPLLKRSKAVNEMKSDVSWLLSADPQANNSEDETRGFQHEMMDQLRGLYSDRKQTKQNEDPSAMSPSEHWRRTGHLKETWQEMQDVQGRTEKFATLQRDMALAQNHFDGSKKHFGKEQMGGMYHWSDEESEERGMRRMTMHDMDGQYLEDHLKLHPEYDQNLMQNEGDDHEWASLETSGPVGRLWGNYTGEDQTKM